jgi:hypothetical protein
MSKIRLMPSVGRCTCQVCGLYAEAARPKATVCAECARDVEAARAHVAAKVAATARRAEAAWLHLNRCVDAAHAAGMGERWGAMRQALEEVHALCASAETTARVRKATVAAEAGNTELVPAELAAALLAHEDFYWASDAARREKLKGEIALVALEDVTGSGLEAA